MESHQGTCKLKSKRGGNIEVLVDKRVAWPQYIIFGGVKQTAYFI